MTQIEKPKYEVRKVADLTNWEDNPRTITKDEFERLKQQIERLGLYKPLLINQQNIVLGGNQRLRALKELGIEEAMCSIVMTDNEWQKIEYALSDNDEMGVTDKEKVAELVSLHPVETKLYHIKTRALKPLSVVVASLSPEPQGEDAEQSQAKGKRTKMVKCPSCDHEFDAYNLEPENEE